METLTSPGKAGFEKVVLVEYPRTGLWTLGFLAGNVPHEAAAAPAHSIFVPTAPNPTTGFMLIVPPEQLRPTDLGVEEALKNDRLGRRRRTPRPFSLPAEAEEKI